MPEPTEALTKQVGPLPLGVWLAAIGGGLGIAWWTRRSKAQAGTVPTLVPATTPADAYTKGAITYVGADSTPGASGPATNEEWGRMAIVTLIGHGWGAVDVQNAIGAYLSGSSTTVQQGALIEMALRYLGPPPVLPPTSVTPPPSGAQPITPTPEVPLAGTPYLNAAGVFSPAKGNRYHLSLQPQPHPTDPAELFVSIGGVFYRVPGAQAFAFGKLAPGYRYYFIKIGEAAAGSAPIEASVNNQTVVLSG